MRVLSFLAVHRALVAILMFALVLLFGPAPGLADTPDAHSESAVVAESHDASALRAAHDDTFDRSCHPDPTCSQAAILMNPPISTAQFSTAARQPLAAMTGTGRSGRVDPPSPRTRSVPRSNNLNETQT